MWLANKIVNGEEPDVFMIVDEDFNTLSSLGVLKDLTEEIEMIRTLIKMIIMRAR